MDRRRYIRFESDKGPWTFSFLRPAGWKLRESIELDRVDIHLLGPRNQANTYSTSLAVSVTQAAGQTAKTAAEALLESYRAAWPCQTQGPTSAIMAGVAVQRVEISHVMLLPLNSLHPQETAIRERFLIFRCNDTLIELRYAAPAEDFDRSLAAFERLQASIAIAPAGGDALLFKPAPQPRLAVAEQQAEYRTERENTDDEPETPCR